MKNLANALNDLRATLRKQGLRVNLAFDTQTGEWLLSLGDKTVVISTVAEELVRLAEEGRETEREETFTYWAEKFAAQLKV